MMLLQQQPMLTQYQERKTFGLEETSTTRHRLVNKQCYTIKSRTALLNSLLDTIKDNHLSQVVETPTRQHNIVDLFPTSSPSLVNQVQMVLPLKEVDHDIVLIDVSTMADIQQQLPQKIYLYHKADWQAIREDLSILHLPEVDFQTKWDAFETALKSSITKNVPPRTKKPSNKKPFVTQKIKRLHRQLAQITIFLNITLTVKITILH